MKKSAKSNAKKTTNNKVSAKAGNKTVKVKSASKLAKIPAKKVAPKKAIKKVTAGVTKKKTPAPTKRAQIIKENKIAKKVREIVAKPAIEEKKEETKLFLFAPGASQVFATKTKKQPVTMEKQFQVIKLSTLCGRRWAPTLNIGTYAEMILASEKMKNTDAREKMVVSAGADLESIPLPKFINY